MTTRSFDHSAPPIDVVSVKKAPEGLPLDHSESKLPAPFSVGQRVKWEEDDQVGTIVDRAYEGDTDTVVGLWVQWDGGMRSYWGSRWWSELTALGPGTR